MVGVKNPRGAPPHPTKKPYTYEKTLLFEGGVRGCRAPPGFVYPLLMKENPPLALPKTMPGMQPNGRTSPHRTARADADKQTDRLAPHAGTTAVAGQCPDGVAEGEEASKRDELQYRQGEHLRQTAVD